MATLFFMRHAKTGMNRQDLWSGRTDCDIADEGKEILKSQFCYTEKDFDVYYCSPLKRTRQTLDAVIPHQNPIIDDRLIERDFGDWEGKPYSIIDEETTELYIQGKVQPPNGETYLEVQERVISFVNDMFNKYKGNERILIVSHATVVRMARDVFLPNMKKKRIHNATIVKVDQEDWRRYNE